MADVSLPFIQRYAKAFGRNQALILRLSGLVAGEFRADGAIIQDQQGNEWLDFGSFGIHLLGHRHPDIVRVASEQLDLMGLSSKILGNGEAALLGEALVSNTSDHLDRVVLGNSGAEVVDMSMKLAMATTNRSRFLALNNSYHGKTLGALSLSDTMHSQHQLGSRHEVGFVEALDVAALTEHLKSGTVAAMIAEPVQGEGGIRPIDFNYLLEAQSLCAEFGTLFIMDEIQTGLGRCGKTWRSSDEIPADIVLSAKTLGGGLLPIAAAIYCSKSIDDKAIDPLLLASSFAGGSLACRVGRAVVDIVTQDEFQANVNRLGQLVKNRLINGLRGNASIAEVRGEGLMIGIECTTPGVAGQAIVEAAANGLLLTFCLNSPNVLRVYPAAVATEQQINSAIEIISTALSVAADKVSETPSKEAN